MLWILIEIVRGIFIASMVECDYVSRRGENCSRFV